MFLELTSRQNNRCYSVMSQFSFQQLRQNNFFQRNKASMIELGSSIISSTIATVILYPAQRIRIQMQLNAVKQPSKETEQQISHLLDAQKNFQGQVLANKVLLREQSGHTSDFGSQITQIAKNQQKNKKKQLPLTLNKTLLKRKNKTSIKQTILSVYTKHGWTGFYTGLQSLTIGNGLSYGVYFVLYEKCKNLLGFEPGSVIDTIKCSGIAGIGSSIATNPFWVLQTKQAQQKGSILQKGSHLIKNEGLLSLWKGLSSSLILVSNPIIQFVIYEQLKKIVPLNKESKLYDLVIFLIGALSKMISTLCTYPLTLIRTKQHISVQKKKWHKIVESIVKADGLQGLYKGIEPKLIQTVLNSALLLMLFQRIRNMMLNYFVSKA